MTRYHERLEAGEYVDKGGEQGDKGDAEAELYEGTGEEVVVTVESTIVPKKRGRPRKNP
jgi:hypothetical protein